MKLVLAVAESCDAEGCLVRLVDGGGAARARYGRQVLNRIKVRPGDLVALDRDAEPPAVVWRWWHGTVERLAGERAVISRNHTQPTPEHSRRREEEVSVPPALVSELHVGGTVFFGETATGVLDVAWDGMPAHPDWLRALLPAVARAYPS